LLLLLLMVLLLFLLEDGILCVLFYTVSLLLNGIRCGLSFKDWGKTKIRVFWF
jgi:hypothetical protein